MYSTLLVIVELQNGAFSRQSLETIAAAQSLNPVKLVVAVAGNFLDAIIPSLQGMAIDQLWLVEHPQLRAYTSAAYQPIFATVIEQTAAELVLFPHSYQTRDFLPGVAAHFKRSVISDCIRISVEEHELVAVRPLFQGRVHASVKTQSSPPVFVSMQAGCYRADAIVTSNDPVSVHSLSPRLPSSTMGMIAEPPFRAMSSHVDLGASDIIVAVGRGIKSAENIQLAQRLADLLGAELAASRPVCDEGWLPAERQVGSSGQTVAPKLYIALGISGAIQHVVGMKGSTTIVAINSDANAPIFKIADYGIVHDLHQVLPAMIKVLENDKT